MNHRMYLFVAAICVALTPASVNASDLSGGVLLVHAPPNLVYSGSICDSTKIVTCQDQVPRTDSEGPIVWFVLSAWADEKSFEGVGFGLGDYLVSQARTCPGKHFVGIETGWLPVKRTLRKIAFAGISNVRILRVDAALAFERLFQERAVESVCCLFPCPWPKQRHAKNRLFSQNFLRLLNSRLMEEGELVIVTDDSAYFAWLQEQVPDTGFRMDSRRVGPQFSTKYEKKWLSAGQEVFYELRLKKHSHWAWPLKEDIGLITYRVEHFDPSRFEPQRCYGNPAVAFKETLYDPVRKKAMIRCIVGEDGFMQNFWVEIVREEALWHIRPAKGCSLLPTYGVQRALDIVYASIR